MVRNLFPSFNTPARKRRCTSTTLRFVLDESFCLISQDFNRACSCLRASLEVSSSKTRKASRTRHMGSVLRSVSGSCSTQCLRSAKVSKGAGGAGCPTLPSAESREPGCSALFVDTCAAPPGADAGCAAPLSGPHCADWPAAAVAAPAAPAPASSRGRTSLPGSETCVRRVRFCSMKFTIRRKDAGSRQDAGSRKQAGRRQALSVQRSPPPSPTHSPAAPAKLPIKPPVREQRFACDAALPNGTPLTPLDADAVLHQS